MRVLSLFDGMSGGQISLGRAGIQVGNYYASEIDKYAIKVTMANYPNTIQLGDITRWREWDIDFGCIDLVLAGSPCQGFSLAGKGLNFDDERSKLFFVFVEILNHIKNINPSVLFLLENVQMKYEHELVISRYVGCNPIVINSTLVSAQNRVRNYWTSINLKPVGLFGDLEPDIQQPKDKSIFLKDILEPEVVEKYYISEKALQRVMGKHPKINPDKSYAVVGNNNTPSFGNDRSATLIEMPDKSYCIDANYHKGTSVENYLKKSRRQLVPCGEPIEIVTHNMLPRSSKNGRGGTGHLSKKDGKSYCLDTNTNTNAIEIGRSNIRRLTEVECERLQTVPDNYTNHVSSTQRYKMLGNGWTVDVIAHILKHIPIQAKS